MEMRENILAGAGLMFAAQFFSASVVTTVKLISNAMTTSCIVFVGYTICLALTCFVVVRQKVSLKTNHLKLQLARGVCGVLYFAGLFLAVKYIPVADAILLRSTSPIWTPIMILLAMHQRINKPIILAIILGFIGIALVLHPTLVGINMGYLIGLSSGVFIALSGILTRELQTLDEPLSVTLFYSFLIPSVALAPIAFLEWPTYVTSKEMMLLTFIGLGTYALLLLFVSAFRYASAVVLMPMTYFGVVIAGIYDWLLWGLVPDAMSSAGLVIIFTACSYIVWIEKHKDKPSAINHARQ